jgi:hypothetical protein
MTNQQECSDWLCKKPARWKCERVGRIGSRAWCDKHFAEKIGKYDLHEIKPIK